MNRRRPSSLGAAHRAGSRSCHRRRTAPGRSTAAKCHPSGRSRAAAVPGWQAGGDGRFQRRSAAYPQSSGSAPASGASRCPIPEQPAPVRTGLRLRNGSGPYLVDAGWNTDDAYNTLVPGSSEAGFAIGRRPGVLVTHIHPDHYGLAGRIREASGAWVALHPADAALIEARYDEPADLLRADGSHAAPGRSPGGGDRRPSRTRRCPVRPWVTSGDPGHPDRGRRQARGRRAGTSPPSGPRATRPAICASTRRPTG